MDMMIDAVLPLLSDGDTIIDGGNADFNATRRRFALLEGTGKHFVGMGVSGGAEGARHGPSMMVGGSDHSWSQMKPMAEAIAAVEANETATIEAFLAKDLDALADTWTEDYIFVDETFGDYVEGKAANRALNADVIKWADPDKTRVLDRFVSEDGTFAVSTWEWIGTNYFGNPFDLPFAMVAEYRDGKIAKQTIYYASPDARSQLLGG